VSTTTELIIGSDVRCSDGPCGELKRVVVDPVARSVTHVVVEPHHRRGHGHLVPIDRVVSTSPDLELSCSTSDLYLMDDADDLQFLPGGADLWPYNQEQMQSWAYYPLGVGMGTAGGSRLSGLGSGRHGVVSDHVPLGDVEVRRGQPIHAIDGAIGRVQGLVIDPADHSVTHVLLDEGHLWGEKRVAIPISAVTTVDGGVRVNLTKHEVGELPAIELADAGHAIPSR
jgi:sporulation protein YlmC with PRC-barrel domain